MAPYSFINKGDICILRPDDVYHLSEEGTGGKFIYKTEDEQILVEGFIFEMILCEINFLFVENKKVRE